VVVVVVVVKEIFYLDILIRRHSFPLPRSFPFT
jgi:hypothetical protein